MNRTRGFLAGLFVHFGVFYALNSGWLPGGAALKSPSCGRARRTDAMHATHHRPLEHSQRVLLQTDASGFRLWVEMGQSCIDPLPNTTLSDGGSPVEPLVEPLDSYEECCEACQQAAGCNCFMFCNRTEGCNDVHGNDMPNGTCVLMYQQDLEQSGTTLKTEGLSDGDGSSWIAGAPISVLISNMSAPPSGWDLFAYGTIPKDAVVPYGSKNYVYGFNSTSCKAVGADGNCLLQVSGPEDASSACQRLEQCYGFEFRPASPNGAGRTAQLLGGGDQQRFSSFLLQLSSSVSPSPNTAIFVQRTPLPTDVTFIEGGITGLFQAPLNMSDSWVEQAGCIMEPDTHYWGDEVDAVLVQNARQCCDLCEKNQQCNVWVFCPNPRGCDHVLGWYKFQYKLCRLRNQTWVGKGNYPKIHQQGETVKTMSGLPRKTWEILEPQLKESDGSWKPRPILRDPGAEGFMSRENAVYGGILVTTRYLTTGNISLCNEQCISNPQCNIFVYCGNSDGCERRDGTNSSTNFHENTGRCILKYQPAVSMSGRAPRVLGESIPELEKQFGAGPDIEWVSGAPINVVPPSDPEGYSFVAYGDLFEIGDFSCPETTQTEKGPKGQPNCRLGHQNLTVEDVAEVCGTLPLCQGFVFLPHGDGVGNEDYTPAAYLKGNQTNDKWAAALKNMTLNPNILFYTQQNEAQQGSSGGSSAVAIAVPVTLGVLAMMVVVAAGLYLWRRRTRSKKLQDSYHDLDKFTDIVSNPSKQGAGGKVKYASSHASSRPKESPPLTSSYQSASHTAYGTGMACGKTPMDSGKPPIDSAYTSFSPSSMHGDQARPQMSSVYDVTGSQVPASVDVARPQMSSSYDVATSSDPGVHASSKASFDETPDDSCSMGSNFTSTAIDVNEIEVWTNADGSHQVIGRGASCNVLRGEWRGMSVALKELHHIGRGSKFQVKDMLKELSIVKRCSHPNIVVFHGAALTDRGILLVFELMEGGDLFQAMRSDRKNSKRMYGWFHKGRDLAIQVAEGLLYLHSRRITHCDMKTLNILLSKDGTAKIGDMGMAKHMMHELVTRGRDFGTWAYAAPELVLNSKISAKVDVYSFGVILWEIVTGEVPTRGGMRKPSAPGECPESVVNIIDLCLITHPDKRPTAGQVVDMLKNT